MPVFKRSILASGFAGWMLIVSFEYNGEPRDYFYEIGDGNMSERQARAVADRMHCESRAQLSFLRDVELTTVH